MLRHLLLPALVAVTLHAADKKPIVTHGANRDVEMNATAYLDKAEIKRILGADLPAGIVLVEVELRPRSGKQLKLAADDFLLRAYNDGQKSGPYAPSQIAGKGGLAITQTGGGGMMTGNPNGPIWGGLGGGRPGRMGGDGGALGNANEPTTTDITEKDTNKEKDNPLLAILKKMSLPEGDTTQTVKGLLYFPLEGKHKGKDIAIQYTGPSGKLILEFRQ